ncbi:tetratricopeptide repeat protein [Parapedobacter sp. 2B3]|uniref:tetratricopeptide repeat-containing sensor histidine kinase n=1 Tax=Parapedobacter sp. 2B3 TaxID=3342381 RepID=UPI0035B6A2B3
MKTSRAILLVLFVSSLTFPCGAQSSAGQRIDSLKKELENDLTKVQKAKVYGDLSWYYNSVSLDSALRYGDEALRIAREIHDRKLIAQSLSDLGAIYFIKGEIDKSLELYNQSLDIRKKENDEEGIASLNFKIGNNYFKKAELEKAMSFYLEALHYYENTQNEYVVANLHSNIAVVYTSLRNYPKALSYLKKAEIYFQRQSLYAPLANVTLSMGNVYYALLDTAKAQDSYEKTIAIAKKGQSFSAEASAYNNLGQIYTDLGQNKRAVDYIQKSLVIRTREKLDSDVASSNVTLAINYAKLRNFSKSKSLLLTSLNYFQQTGGAEKITLIYYQLIESYAGLGEVDSVFHYMNLYKQSQSAELDNKVIEVSNELETKYQTEKKEQQIEILNQETAIQKLRLRQRGLLLLAAMVVLVSGGILVFFVFKQRRLKAEARLQQEINTQQEKATRDVLNAEERERRRIASDLHDGVGQTLSAALLNLNYLYKSITDGKTPEPQVMDNALGLVKDSYQEMRSISHQMMPNALLKAGLATSIKEFLDAIDGKDIKVHLSVSGLADRLDQQLETVLYRAVQEAVNNVVKHARASRLTIQLMKDDEGVSVTIEDNGVGFDASRLDEVAGIGLKNIRSRVALLQGSVEVDTAMGRGTVVVIFIPA